MLRNAFLILACFLILVPLAVGADQVLPCQSSLTNSIRLANDWVCPLGGPSLDTVGIVLDCQGHKIVGPGSGVGVTVSADRAVIKDCDISNFQVGVMMKNLAQATIQDSGVHDNSVGVFVERVRDARVSSCMLVGNSVAGIYSKASFLTSVQNMFNGNGKDVHEIDPLKLPPPVDEEPAMPSAPDLLPPAPSLPNLVSPDAPEVMVFDNRITEAMLSILGVGSDARSDAIRSLDIRKALRADDPHLVVSTVVQAGAAVDNLTIFEVIPSSLAESALDVASSTPFEIAYYDPVALKFFIGRLVKGQEARIEYRVARPRSWDLSSIPQSALPSSVAVSQPIPRWEPSMLVEVVFFVFLVCFAVWFYYAFVCGRRRVIPDLVFTAAIVAFFVAYDLDLVVIVGRVFHEFLVVAVLALASIWYGVRAWIVAMNCASSGRGSHVDERSRDRGRKR